MKSEVYLEGETYRHALVIIVFRLCGVLLLTEEDTCRTIFARSHASVWNDVFMLACFFRRKAL